MGYSRSTSADWGTYLDTTVRSKGSTKSIYTSRKMVGSLSPKGINREARDSATNPESTPIIVGLDVTGSMSRILDAMARHGLETMATQIYDRKPVTDPQLMCMGVGDAFYDSAPLQVTQFESDIKLAEQLTQIWLEEGGGGNDSEGYILAWYFAAFHTQTDAWDKRGKKGFLFTIGDDGPTPYITKEQIEEVFGETPEFEKITAEQLYKIVSEKYEVWHLCVEEGGSHRESDVKRWRDLIGERAIILRDHKKMGEVITSILQAFTGENKTAIVNSWDGTTGLIVQEAIKNVMANEVNEIHVFK